MIVTIDGPAGAGKSTVSRALAERLGLIYLDTGAIYRATALAARDLGPATLAEIETAPEPGGLRADLQDRLERLAESLPLRFTEAGTRVWLADREVTREIRTPEVSQWASRISAIPSVRRGLLALQRKLGEVGDVVAEGRDVGSVVFPKAQVKFFLTADLERRAARRVAELVARGAVVDEATTRAEMEQRDARDANRAAAPLVCPEGAIRIDSSELSVEEVVDRMARAVRSAASEPSRNA